MSEHVHENGEPADADPGETSQDVTEGVDAGQVEPDPAGSQQTDTEATEPEATEPGGTAPEATEPEATALEGDGSPQAPAPETGDLVIDAALRDLAEAPEDDLDAQVERGEQVQRTLQGRLSDLGG